MHSPLIHIRDRTGWLPHFEKPFERARPSRRKSSANRIRLMSSAKPISL
jgi:hypothetical protein